MGVDHQHATNVFCIAPRLAESGAHSMDSSFSRHFCIIAGPNRVWVKAFLHNCTAGSGVGVDHQHATNDFCVAPRLAESGAHSMDSSFSRHFCMNSKYSGEHCDLLVTRNGICSTGLVRCTLSNATLV